jgi:F1F0 ATPase subunit 2
MLNDTPALLLAGTTGVLLGAFFFGGLWWTVKKGLSAARPALWFAASLVLRMAVVLIGFYLVFAGHWERLLLCLLGFLMARLLMTRLARPRGDIQARPAPEVRHAP